MRKFFLPAAVLLALAAVTTALATGNGSRGRPDDDRNETEPARYAIGLWGDLPYSTVQSDVGIPNLIADMNSQDLAFSAHDGDLKAGSNSPCDDALYTYALARLLQRAQGTSHLHPRRQRLDRLRPTQQWRIQLAGEARS